MKKILILVLLFVTSLITNNVWSQVTPKSGANYPNPELNKFIGNWIWVNKSDTIFLATKKENLKFSGNLSVDALTGHFKQIKAKKIIRDGIKTSNQGKSSKVTKFTAGMNQSGNTITGSLEDHEANKAYKISIFLSDDQKSLTIVLTGPEEGIRLGNSSNSSIPKKMIFKRLEK